MATDIVRVPETGYPGQPLNAPDRKSHINNHLGIVETVLGGNTSTDQVVEKDRGLFTTSSVCLDRPTFWGVLEAEKDHDMSEVKNLAYAANRLAKTTTGRSRNLYYAVKNKAISTLVIHGEAFVNSIDLALNQPEIGVSFFSGGELHTRPGALDPPARLIIETQVLAALRRELHGMRRPG